MDFIFLFRGTYPAWTQERWQLWDVYMVNMLILFNEIMYVIRAPLIWIRTSLHVTGSVSTKLPADGDVDLSEEEMEQSVFGQESSLVPTTTINHNSNTLHVDLRCTFDVPSSFRLHEIGAIRCCTNRCCARVVFCMENKKIRQMWNQEGIESHPRNKIRQ